MPGGPITLFDEKVGQVKADRRRAGEGVRFQIEGRAATRAVIVHVEHKRRRLANAASGTRNPAF